MKSLLKLLTISQHKPAIVFLIETKIREKEEFGRLQRTLGFDHAEGFLSVGQSGGLGLFWNEETRVHIHQPSHARFIDAVVDDDNGSIQWRLTCFYSNSSAAERQESWNLIRSLSDDDSLPWVVLGDFNEMVHSSEKLDGRLRLESQMRGFREALSYAELVDLGFHGCPYTWSDYETKVRLDRVVVTAAWLDSFSHSRVIHLPPSKSDHIPILLRVSANLIVVRKRFYRFWFEALWLQYDRCHELVQEQWHKPVSGQPMFLVAKKIENTSIALDKWQRPFFGIGRRLSMQSVAITPSVSEDLNLSFCAPYSSEEVREALFQMYPTKSPGPDGMPPLFFQHYWESIGTDVTEVVHNFLHSGQLLKQINFTHICLIPKVDSPETMADLRPIALCNVIYKLCSKVIANRLKILLPQIISPFQSAFIPGRLITDNMLAANELAYFIHNKRSGDEFMALKLDLSKAYDRLEWCFLQKVMERMGFAASWIQMVMQCVTTIRYSFLVRGKPRGYVVPTRGLRQGDPLSPYLFLLGVVGLSALLLKKAELGVLPGISICKGAPMVNHLLFADDSMLYAKANLQACQAISNVLEVYGKASGQQVNFHKSSVTFSKNVGIVNQRLFASSLGVEVVESHEKYLGLPTFVGKNKTSTFQYIQERLNHKLKTWQGRLLSGAGKDILIRVVVQSFPTYAMSCFQLTKKICDDLQQGWRILQYLESLIARMYKARYFPNSTFWEAESHPTRSFSWRSIFATRSVLEKGARWQIGDGKDILLSDPWVCHGDDIPSILSIPLSSRQVTDRWIWHFDTKGLFSDKSAYRLLMEEARVEVVPDQTRNSWKKLWSANLPCTAKIFLWKVLNNCLPTVERLIEKQVPLESRTCILCGVENETVEHLCRYCSFVMETLAAMPGLAQVEALAGREAVSLAIQRGLSLVIFETDSVTLLHATKQRVIPHTSFIGRVYDDIIFHLQQMQGSYFTYAYRQANVVAHNLASFAYSSSSSLFWGSEPPSCIIDVLSKEFSS
ncbi:uncharacterized protein LOC133711342 [Rosa rugosa]|uniref:uncharacterized protein LOC133711342 n=1 Tax=Rosa rugosa TaxID=74645 RepID=UPI002B4150A8|nr:uncharacterized protein LOC133711342 [Rosa rugosa]